MQPMHDANIQGEMYMMYTDASRGINIAKDPAVVKFNDNYYMYYSVSPAKGGIEGWDIGIARSQDLTNWTKIAEMGRVGDIEQKGICAPAAIVIHNTLHLFYQSYGSWSDDAICHATSKDGVNFVRDKSNPVFRPTGGWNNGRAIDADVLLFNQQLFLYFATRDPAGNVQMLGVAQAPADSPLSRSDWVQCVDESILKPQLNWEQECIEAPATLVHKACVYLFYAGAYNNAPQQIGVAVSNDGINFTRMSDDPFLANGHEGAWNASESGHPYIFEDNNGRVYLFYQGNNDNGRSWSISKVEIVFHDDKPQIVEQSYRRA